jgi:hypothetical protein
MHHSIAAQGLIEKAPAVIGGSIVYPNDVVGDPRLLGKNR